MLNLLRFRAMADYAATPARRTRRVALAWAAQKHMTARDDLYQLVNELDDALADELLQHARRLAADENKPLSPRSLPASGQGEAIAAGDCIDA
jgi:restriction endonuclease Mrr